MFTRKEFLFMWAPMMFVGGVIFSVMVVNRTITTPTAIVALVVLGILLKLIARKINTTPSTPTPESEPTNDAQ